VVNFQVRRRIGRCGRRFLARASHRGNKHILTDESIKIPKLDDMGLMLDKEKVKKLNEKAYMELIHGDALDDNKGRRYLTQY
jgi:hypothetical protein